MKVTEIHGTRDLNVSKGIIKTLKNLSHPSIMQPFLDSSMALYESKSIYNDALERLLNTSPEDIDSETYIQSISDTTARALVLPFAYALPLASNRAISKAFNLFDFLEQHGFNDDFKKAIEPITGFHTQTYFLKLFNEFTIQAFREIISKDLNGSLASGKDLKDLNPLTPENANKFYRKYLQSMKNQDFAKAILNRVESMLNKNSKPLTEKQKEIMTSRLFPKAASFSIPYLLSLNALTGLGFLVGGYHRINFVSEAAFDKVDPESKESEVMRKRIYPLLPTFTALFGTKQLVTSVTKNILDLKDQDLEDLFVNALSSLTFVGGYIGFKTPAQKILENILGQAIQEQGLDKEKSTWGEKFLEISDRFLLPSKYF